MHKSRTSFSNFDPRLKRTTLRISQTATMNMGKTNSTAILHILQRVSGIQLCTDSQGLALQNLLSICALPSVSTTSKKKSAQHLWLLCKQACLSSSFIIITHQTG